MVRGVCCVDGRVLYGVPCELCCLCCAELSVQSVSGGVALRVLR